MGSRRGRPHPGTGDLEPGATGRSARGGRLHQAGSYAQQAPQGRGRYQGRGSYAPHLQQRPRDHHGDYPGRGQPYSATHFSRGGRAGRGTAPLTTESSSSPLAPELRQAMEAPHEHAQASPLQAGPSESTPQALSPEYRMPVQAEPSAIPDIVPATPTSSKSIRFPLRPGKGSIGTRCLVKANHFFAELPDKDLHQYDVR